MQAGCQLDSLKEIGNLNDLDVHDWIILFKYCVTWMGQTELEIKCQLDATEVFIADLIACSTCFVHHYAHHQELKSIMQWLLSVVFRAVVFQVAGLMWS